MAKRQCSASVRTIVEFALLSGSLMPGAQLSRMREGMLGHQARQRAHPQARAEVSVRGQAQGEEALLEVSGRIDLLYERDGIPVVEEIKLAAADAPPEAPIPAHRAQAVCYGHLLGVEAAIIRVAYVLRDGAEVIAFEEWMQAEAMVDEFDALVRPYLQNLDACLRWESVRDASVRELPFPFAAYRAGQRDMAAQVFWAIKLRRRLFAQAPTGTGKTAAALYPALKALGEGLSRQIYYLTARTTGQENATQAIERMRGQGLHARVLRMTAKEKLCPYAQAARGQEEAWRCDLLSCPRAIGFFDRLGGAIEDMRGGEDWSREAVEAMAARHQLCPHEFSLCLCEEADVVIGDYNYAFDPVVRIRRIFQGPARVTLLVDEAHNLPDRARDMYSAVLDSGDLREVRRAYGKLAGRKRPLYTMLTALVRCVEDTPQGASAAPPEDLRRQLEDCMEAVLQVAGEVPLGELPRTLLAALGTLERYAAPQYQTLCERAGRYTRLTLFCMDPAPYLMEATRRLRGTVYFSATLTPLFAWREVIGGTEEDGLLSLPSPFPPENLLVLRHGLSTKYHARATTVTQVASAILSVALARPGNYLACFPSYAYLGQVREAIEAAQTPLRLHVQRSGMDDAARAEFLAAFVPRQRESMLGMVVLGGVFGEGVDLPGERLCGVVVVGVGLPQVCPERDLLRKYYDEKDGTGFAQAYQYPGMNKVLQAVGRVIRTQEDRGVALLVDDRFLGADYAGLMPPWWHPADAIGTDADLADRLRAFWREGGASGPEQGA